MRHHLGQELWRVSTAHFSSLASWRIFPRWLCFSAPGSISKDERIYLGRDSSLLHRYPRINKESLLPVATDLSMKGQNAEAWYPPGHGDIYASFYNSGLLDQLIAQGREYIFVSNIDNLGATVDLHILHQLVSQPNGKRCEFIMEVTDKTRADVKVRKKMVSAFP